MLVILDKNICIYYLFLILSYLFVEAVTFQGCKYTTFKFFIIISFLGWCINLKLRCSWDVVGAQNVVPPTSIIDSSIMSLFGTRSFQYAPGWKPIPTMCAISTDVLSAINGTFLPTASFNLVHSSAFFSFFHIPIFSRSFLSSATFIVSIISSSSAVPRLKIGEFWFPSKSRIYLLRGSLIHNNIRAFFLTPVSMKSPSWQSLSYP